MDDDDWVPLDPLPNLMEMLEAWATSTDPNIGWCLLCNRAIKDEGDLIVGTSTHNCLKGQALENMINSFVLGSDITDKAGEDSSTKG